jgi:CubicO group peptidase (beta-lactamase class C family)
MNEKAALNDRVRDFCEASGIPGFVAGVHHAGRQSVVAHGVANTATGEPMRAGTGFLFGSVTKIMTTTLVMREVERGTLGLDSPVTAYLPEFRLNTRGAAERILVRHLVNHTSGIDADLFFPDGEGPDALRIYVERLGRECGALFPAGEFVSYSNGGMIVAGRLLEVVTGLPYDELLKRDILARSTPESVAVGHFPDPATGRARPTGMFRLPSTWAPAGGTAIGTIEDLLDFGRVHLGDGTAPSGRRVLRAGSVALMRSVHHDMGTPDSSPVGLGWLIRTLGGTSVLTMTGASPGGVAVLAVVPDRELVFAAFGNDARALTLHEELLAGLTGETRPQPLVPVTAELEPYAGTFRSGQLRVDVRVVDGELEEQVTYEPADAGQERIFTGFIGGEFAAPPMRYVPVGKDLFAPAGLPLDDLPAHFLVSYHGGGAYRCTGGRLTRRVPV